MYTRYNPCSIIYFFLIIYTYGRINIGLLCFTGIETGCLYLRGSNKNEEVIVIT